MALSGRRKRWVRHTGGVGRPRSPGEPVKNIGAKPLTFFEGFPGRRGLPRTRKRASAGRLAAGRRLAGRPISEKRTHKRKYRNESYIINFGKIEKCSQSTCGSLVRWIGRSFSDRSRMRQRACLKHVGRPRNHSGWLGDLVSGPGGRCWAPGRGF